MRQEWFGNELKDSACHMHKKLEKVTAPDILGFVPFSRLSGNLMPSLSCAVLASAVGYRVRIAKLISPESTF